MTAAHPLLPSLLLVSVAAQQPEPPPLLPLHEAARWTYAVERQAAAGAAIAASTLEVVDEGGFTLPDGARVHQLRVTAGDGTPPTFVCRSVRADGVYEHRCEHPARRGTIDLDAVPLRVVALPLPADARWHGFGCLANGDDVHADWLHQTTLLARDVAVAVPAGEFRAVHVRIRSTRGQSSRERELWLAPGTGIVREELRADGAREVRRLTAFEPGRDVRRAELRAHLAAELHDPNRKPYDHPPWIAEIDDAPEAMLLPGRICIARAGTWTRCYYVDAAGAHPFDYLEADRAAVAARAAFGSDSALPPETVPAEALALLVARTHAEVCNLRRLRRVEPTLQPAHAAPHDGRHAHVELRGGAPDGTMRRVAVWLTLARSSHLEVVADATALPPLDR